VPDDTRTAAEGDKKTMGKVMSREPWLVPGLAILAFLVTVLSLWSRVHLLSFSMGFLASSCVFLIMSMLNVAKIIRRRP
jgi:hypothetical protein